MEIPILFEDDHLLALNKPAGVTVHEDGHTDGWTVCDWVREHRPDMVSVGEPMRLQNGIVIDRPGIVHRLDRETSGVLVLAKTQESFLFLKEQFKNRTIEKHYRAFVWGEVTAPNGTIDRPIGRSRRDFRRWSAGPDASGTMRAATTRFTVLAKGKGFSYLDLEPKTGRTHQIRVHLKAVGHPMVCDSRYAALKPPALGFTRLALHAHLLILSNVQGVRLAIEAPFPEDFNVAMQGIDKF